MSAEVAMNSRRQNLIRVEFVGFYMVFIDVDGDCLIAIECSVFFGGSRHEEDQGRQGSGEREPGSQTAVPAGGGAGRGAPTAVSPAGAAWGAPGTGLPLVPLATGRV